jgi:hypothetical protein
MAVGDINLIAKINPYNDGFTGMVDAKQVIGGASNRLPDATMPALTGDVTTTAGAVATTIANSAVTLAKMANMATAALIYRKTAGSGAPEVNTLATLKTDLGLTGTNSGDQTITLTGNVTGTGTTSFATTIAAGVVTEAMQVLADNTTQDVSTTKHGYVPKAPNDTTKFLRGDATWAVPSSGGLTWSVITADQSAAINNGYICNKGTLLTLTLPGTAAVGSVIEVVGMNAGLWKVAQNASGVIHFGNQDTTTGVGGSISSVLTRDAVRLVCVVANNEWNVISSMGNITVT